MERYATLMVSIVLLVALAIPASAQHSFTESFTTTTYENTVYTVADWDTTVSDIKPLPFVARMAGAYYLVAPAFGVAMSGNLAFVADGVSGLQIVDISDPANPTLAGDYALGGVARGVAVSGNLAFVADYTSGLYILDVSNPATPTMAGHYSGGANGVAVAGDLAFLAGLGGLDIVDISDPTNPTHVGAYGTENQVLGVAVSGNLAFTVDQDSLQIFDISDPTAPTLAGAYGMPDALGASGVAVAGDLVFVADGDSGLQIINISDPANPTLAGAYDTPGSAYGVAVSGNLAFVADSGGGLQVIDISDPTNPAFAESYNTSFAARGVAVDGDRAFIADNGGSYGRLDIVRISNPTPPALVGTYDATESAFGVAVDGDLAFVPDDGSGLQIINISDPANPTLVGAYDTPGSAYDVAVSGNLAFVADAYDGLQIINISDPSNPTLTGALETGYSANRVVVDGDLAFVTDYDSLEVIDISDPTNPTLTGAFDTGSGAAGLAVDGDLAFVTDAAGGLEVIDVTNPASPTLVGTYATPDVPYGVAVAGDLAFVADGNGGLQIIDITNPASPTLVGTYATPDRASRVVVDGDLAFVAEGNGGLQIIDISDPTNPTLAGTYDTLSDGVSVAGDFAFVGGGSLKVLQVFQHEVSPYFNHAQSLPVDGANDLIVRARLSSTQTPDVSWKLSADGGATFDSVTAGGDWIAFTTPGSDLVWFSKLTWAVPGGPSVSDVTIEWLNEFGFIASVNDIPNDQGKQVRLQWTRSGHDFVGDASQIVEYAVYRKIDPNLTTTSPQAAAPSLDNLSAAAREKTLMMQAAGWDFVTTVPVRTENNYAVVVPTLEDSTITSGGYMTTFMVSALTATPGVFFDSPPDSGYSVDNLAPSVPANFVVAYNTGSGNTLSWDKSPDADFQYFRVYRSIDPNFTPGPGNLVQSTTSRGWVDPDNNGGGTYYKVTATDFSGNESDPASPGTTTGVQKPAVPTTFALFQNVPNPFNPETTIRYDVARGGGNVTVAIYDVGGRLVKTLVDDHESAGQKSVVWDGRNSAGQTVATGTYFYRLTAPGFTQTRKMVLLK